MAKHGTLVTADEASAIAAALAGGSSSGGSTSGGSSGSSSSGGSSSGGTVASCTGKLGQHRGKVLAKVDVKGTQRSFIYYAPESLDANKPAPVIISPHGFAMTGEQMYVMTGFKELADREGLVAVFPEGNAGSPWNVGVGVSGVGALVANLVSDDQSFLDAIIEYAKADQCIDEKHMFVSGFSMGGYFSNENGCVRSDIASVGPHSGGSHDLASCTGSKKPIILFHGDADALITYQDNGVVARDRWVQRNGCSKEVESKTVNGGVCEYSKGCPDHAQVTLCTFKGMGHLWAGGQGDAAHGAPNVERASELAWTFWKQYAW